MNESSVVNGPEGSAQLAIEAENLVKTYPNQVRALDGLSFCVQAGTVFALLGPNGAGKSTTIKVLNTLSHPDSGKARVAGIDVLKNPDRVRRVIGCVAQKASVDMEYTGRENLVLQGQIHGMRGETLRSRVNQVLERFELAVSADRRARTYSGGMQRKLDIAMGLIHRPRVLFLDEPTTGLDPEARTDLWEEISLLSHHEGITVLLTTHYLDEADRLADRVGIVDRGRLVAEGTPEQLKAELQGDSIHMELKDAAEYGRIDAALRPLSIIGELSVAGHIVSARAQEGATAVPAMIGALESGGMKVASVRVARPSLDDVYLRHTGRSFSDADQGVSQ